MNFELHPPQAAGPLRIGATGQDTVEILRHLGTPLVLCRTHGRRPGGAFTAHRARSSEPISTLMTAWKPSNSDGQTATTTPSPTTVSTCSPHQRPTSSASCVSAPPSTWKRKTGTSSPHPACICHCGRSRQSHQTSRKAGSSGASSSHGLATATSLPSETSRAENDQSTGLDNYSEIIECIMMDLRQGGRWFARREMPSQLFFVLADALVLDRLADLQMRSGRSRCHRRCPPHPVAVRARTAPTETRYARERWRPPVR
jgi:hypothetical protein